MIIPQPAKAPASAQAHNGVAPYFSPRPTSQTTITMLIICNNRPNAQILYRKLRIIHLPLPDNIVQPVSSVQVTSDGLPCCPYHTTLYGHDRDALF